jgi:glycosyltransferase involved in cell wall biosynthesis
MNISVVITTFNRAPLLERTLHYLRSQAYEPGDEVIVVNNASSDHTSAVIARAAADFPVPLHQLLETEAGKSPALNAGLALARGEILALTDDDVIVAEDWLSTIRGLFADPHRALVGGRVDPLWESPAPSWLRVECNGRYGEMSSPLALLHYGEAQDLGARTAVGANLIVRRSVMDALGGFAPHLGRRRGTLLCGEDHDFCQRAGAAGFSCEYRPEVRVRHWVPAERTRLAYHVRWFFWSGVTNAVLERGPATARSASFAVPRYLWRELLTAPLCAIGALMARRSPASAAHVMRGAYAAGYIAQRARDWWTYRPAERRSDLPTISGVNG